MKKIGKWIKKKKAKLINTKVGSVWNDNKIDKLLAIVTKKKRLKLLKSCHTGLRFAKK